MIQHSKKISDFFIENDDIEGFWDALREDCMMKPDHEWWEEDEDDGFEAGVALGAKAKEENKPIIAYSTSSNTFYWVGTEDEVLARLRDGWEMWQKEHPLKDPAEQRRQQLEQERLDKEHQLQRLKNRISEINAELGVNDVK